MADRGRDLKVSILSDVDRFDLDKPVEQLEKLGKEALETAKELDKSVDKIDDSFDALAKDAKSTADKVDNAFDKIAKSSRSNLRKVDDDTDKAKKGLDDFKDEASSTGREAAASFSGGFNDITDAIQETAANAFAGFGPAGAAAGLAAAAGLGFITNKLQETAEKIKEVRDNLTDLFKDPGTTQLDRVEDFFTFLRDNGDLPGLQKALKAAGVSMSEFIDAGVNGGPKVDEIKRKLFELGNTTSGLAGLWDGNVRAAQGAYDALNQYRQGVDGATQDTAIMSAETKGLQKVTEETAAATAAATEKLTAAYDTTVGAIREVGDASDEIAAAVEEDGQVTLSAIEDILKAQTKAARGFTKNLNTIAKEGDAQFTAWVSEQGPEFAQAYVDGSKKDKQAVYNAYKENVGAQQALGVAGGLDANKFKVTDAAGRVYSATKDALTGEVIVVPVDVQSPSANELARLRAGIIGRLGTINIPTGVYAPRYGAGRYLP